MPFTPPAALVRHIREGRCMLFAGSGLSAFGGLPTWKVLLSEILNELRVEQMERTDLEELEQLLADGKYLEIADYCKEQLGEQRYGQFLTNLLRGSEADISEAHKIIVQLPFSACVTTNYDKLLERAYYEYTRSIPRTPIHSDVETLGMLLFDKSFFLLKAHGDIDRPETLILTANDYQEIIHANPAFNAVFSAILLTNAILFIGYSLNDPDFRMLFDKQLTTFNKYTPERYALMSGIGRVERDVLWRTARIRVLSYDEGQHEQVLSFLQALREEVEMQETEDREVKTAKIGTRVVEEAVIKETAVVDIENLSGGIFRTPHSVLSIRQRGLQLESALKTGENEISAQGVAKIPDWSKLSQLLRVAVAYHGARGQNSEGQRYFHVISELLAECFSENVLHALQAIPKNHLIILDLAPEIETLPWEWSRTLSDYLYLRNPIVRAPIGISNEARGYPRIRKPVRALLIGCRIESLPGVHREIIEISKMYEKHSDAVCITLLGYHATFDSVVKHLLTSEFDIVHFAGHAWFDDQEAFLEFHSKVEFRASELRSLLSKQPPAILILNSHYTAFVPLGGVKSDNADLVMLASDLKYTSTASSAKRGFTEAALTAGVGSFIGCLGSPSDDIAADIGIALHKQLLKGAPIATALHRTRLSSLQNEQKDMSGLFYVISGYPDLALLQG